MRNEESEGAHRWANTDGPHFEPRVIDARSQHRAKSITPQQEETDHVYGKHTAKAETKIKYFVEIYRGEEEGGLKTVEFQKRRPALEFAERQHKRGYAVIVFNKDGKKIYDEM